MNEVVEGAGASLASGAGEEDPSVMERRIFRLMCWTVGLAVIISLPFAPWRVTSGLALGGALALFNHHWLRTSVSAIFGATPAGTRPRLKAARYVLRYVVVAALVTLAYKLEVISLVATLAGMCVFVVAALIEGFRQLFIAIVYREES